MEPERRGPRRGRSLWLLLPVVLLGASCARTAQEGSRPQATQELSGSALYRGSSAHGAFRQVQPADVAAHRASTRVVDVREPGEFNDRLGHIPGAELVPLGTLGERAASWDRDAEVVVVCRSGARSSRAASTLAGMGFRRVMNMSGGMLAYSSANLPVEREGAAP